MLAVYPSHRKVRGMDHVRVVSIHVRMLQPQSEPQEADTYHKDGAAIHGDDVGNVRDR